MRPVKAEIQAPKTSVLDNAVLERITYTNDETGYTIAKVSLKGNGDLLTIVGSLVGTQPGESLRLEGWWKSHPQYGRQFEVRNYTTILPATIQGIRRYLGSGLIKGIGPKLAERIVEHFDLDTLSVIEEEPRRLVEVPGLGAKRTMLIAAAWEEQKAIKEVMIFLQGVNVSTSLAVRIYKKYGDSSISVVRNEPYRLASDVWGIGFKTADVIAQQVGIPHDSPDRVKAGMQFTLSEAGDRGHCYLPEDELITQAAAILDVDRSLIGDCLAALVADEGLVREALDVEGAGVVAYFLPPFHSAEVSLATALMTLRNTSAERLSSFATVDWNAAFAWFEKDTGITLASEQSDAVRLALSERVAVLTGGRVAARASLCARSSLSRGRRRQR